MREPNPGDFRTQVTFQARTVTSQDSYGQDVFTWATQFTGWFSVTATEGREIEAAKQLNAEAKYRMVGHYPPVTIKREWRAVLEDRMLNVIDAGDAWGTRRWIVVQAKEWAE